MSERGDTTYDRACRSTTSTTVSPINGGGAIGAAPGNSFAYVA